jgi:hypothetical protein
MARAKDLSPIIARASSLKSDTTTAAFLADLAAFFFAPAPLVSPFVHPFFLRDYSGDEIGKHTILRG